MSLVFLIDSIIYVAKINRVGTTFYSRIYSSSKSSSLLRFYMNCTSSVLAN